MKLNTRRIFSLILAVTVIFGITACNGSTGAPTSPQSTGSTAAPASSSTASGDPASKLLRFSWWGSDARHEATIKVMDMYSAQNPDITMEGEYGGFDGYLEKMITQIAANTAPDIMQIDYAYLDPFWGQMDNFVDFNKDTIVDKSGFGDDMLKGISAPSGELIGLPTGLNYSIVFANQQAADTYGIDITEQFTWEKLMEDGKKVHAQDPEAYLLFANGVNRYIFEPYIFNMTGKKLVESDYTLGFTRDDLVKAYQFITDLYSNGVLQPFEETVELKAPYENPAWLNGKIVMFCDLSSGFDPALASMPDSLVSLAPIGDSNAANTGIMMRPTNMLAVNAKSANLEDALKFVNFFFNDKEAIDTLGLVRSVPSTSNALDLMVETGRLDQGLKSIAEWAASHKGGAGQNVISTNVELETIEKDVLDALYYGDLTVETAADEFMKLMTDKVAELKAISEKK